MKRLVFSFCLCIFMFAAQARAEDMNHPGNFKTDDRVIFDVSAEDWVTTKSAHVAVAVEAAVNASTAGTMRTEMSKAVDSLAKGDWRLTSFDRSQDQTGMERWSAIFEARLPESDLGGLVEAAKKISKAGLQVSVANIDFTPTLEETEAVRSSLRTQIYKIVNDQLAALNAAMPGRVYRIALVDFIGDSGSDATPMPRVIKGRAVMANMMTPGTPVPEETPAPAPVERAEKISLTARIVFATAPENKPVVPAPAPVPTEMKH